MSKRQSRQVLFGALLAVVLVWGSPAAGQEWTQSKWGPEDEIGSANYITPERVKLAASLVKTGKTYALGMVTGPDTPAYPPRHYKVYVWDTVLGGPNELTTTDDLAVTWLGVGSQIDGFGHVGIDHVHYNGWKTQDFLSLTGIKKFGVENIPPIVARGVLLDMTKYYAVDIVPNGTAFNSKEIDEVVKRQGIEIREGDVVLFHTGWLEQFAQMGEGEPKLGFPEPGIGVEGARYLAGKGVVAVGADTWALEAIPFEKEAERFPVHQELLAKNGTYILENMNTAALAADAAYEFMFVLGAPRMAGAVQTIVNPVAIR